MHTLDVPRGTLFAAGEEETDGKTMSIVHDIRICGTILFLAALGLTPCPAPAGYSGGSGTALDPYQIATAADLLLLAYSPQDYDKHFLLTADLDLDPRLPGRKVWTRALIAPNSETDAWSFQGTPFAGVFDGNGHRISHLTGSGENYLGLFGRLDYRAEIRNLGVGDVNLAGSGGYVGGLAGDNSGRVIRCYSTGTVRGGDVVGGLLGRNGGTVTNCDSAAAVDARYHVGGLAGYGYYGTVVQCFSTGAVRGTDYVGGLLGYGYYGTAAQCFSTGAVHGRHYVGGLLGSNHFGTVTDCYGTGAVAGTAYVGGLLGDNGGSVVYCYSVGVVSGEDTVGGVVGDNRGTVSQCFWDAQTSGQARERGGPGKTTRQMQTAATFLEAGWDFVGETENGTVDLWWIPEGEGYPRLSWETAVN
jgi:hypothetical protein